MLVCRLAGYAQSAPVCRARQQRPARPQDAPATGAGLFEDEEAAAFYQSLPDLRAVVPAVLLGEAEPAGGAAARSTAPPGESETAAAAGDAAGDGSAAAEQPCEAAPPASKAAPAAGTPGAGTAGALRSVCTWSTSTHASQMAAPACGWRSCARNKPAQAYSHITDVC